MGELKMPMLVEMKGITKVYPDGTVANNDVAFELRKGEIHAIVGENGAGKSTLMRILYGLELPTSGQINLNGRPVRIQSPSQAIKLGIGMVHQNFMLVPAFTIAQNVVFGAEPTRGWFKRVCSKDCVEVVRDLSHRYGLPVDPNRIVDSAPVGMRQRAEILKMLYRGAQILILDEPTQVLAPQEVNELFQGLQLLVKQGASIIFITHKLKEVKEIADRITVMRGGKVVGTLKASEATEEQIARMMVGREVLMSFSRPESRPGKTILETSGLGLVSETGQWVLRDISFDVRAGEVFGIVGVEGNGQSELVEVLTGLRPPTIGTIRIDGRHVSKIHPHSVRNAGVSHIPEDRVKTGLALDASLEENLIGNWYKRKPFRRGPFIDRRQVSRFASEMVKEFDIRSSSTKVAAGTLSGGNMQKLVVARVLSVEHKLLVAAQPTRGVDIGASQFIYERLLRERARGTAVLLITSELSEVMALADRIGVIYNGRLVAILDNREGLTVEELGLYMLGLKSNMGRQPESQTNV